MTDLDPLQQSPVGPWPDLEGGPEAPWEAPARPTPSPAPTEEPEAPAMTAGLPRTAPAPSQAPAAWPAQVAASAPPPPPNPDIPAWSAPGGPPADPGPVPREETPAVDWLAIAANRPSPGLPEYAPLEPPQPSSTFNPFRGR